MIGEMREPGYLEGGDFFPAGRDLALLGIGLRCAGGRLSGYWAWASGLGGRFCQRNVHLPFPAQHSVLHCMHCHAQ